MRKFIALEDITIFGHIAIKKDQIIKLLDDFYQINTDKLNLPLPLSEIINDPRFEELKPNLEFKISEVKPDEDLQIKKYRIQIDVETSKKKFYDIEEFIRTTIEQMLYD